MNKRYTPAGLCLAFLLVLSSFQHLTAQCVLACNNQVNLSLPADVCQAEITFDFILEAPDACTPNGPAAFEVTVMTQAGVTIPTSPFVNETHVGQNLKVEVRHIASNNVCWGNLLVEDKAAPVLTCPADITIPCTASTAPLLTGEATATDCSAVTLTSFDQATDNNCANGIAKIITRTFTAVDPTGMQSVCQQTISVLAPVAADIVFPANLDGIANPALDCATNPSTDPDVTGRPTVNGAPILPGGNCPIVVDFEDVVLPNCGDLTKILRTWTVVIWCTGEILTDTQLIKIADNTPPSITCPAALNVGSTSSINCSATVSLPPAVVTDDCSPGDITVRVFTPQGVLNSNGGLLINVPLGDYVLTYEATDACGNVSTCDVPLSIEDEGAPTVICDEFTTTSLLPMGFVDLPASVFDDGSYDNCCGNALTFEVRRMEAACGQSTTFGPFVRLCCEDAGIPVEVEMRVTDCFGNANSCMVFVTAFNPNVPQLTCPADVTLTCDQDFTDLALTGMATATGTCGAPNVNFTDMTNLNQCGIGTVTRTFTAGNGVSCTQTITLIDNTPLLVNFPPDYTVTDCIGADQLDPEDLPAPFDFPTYPNADCELPAYNFSDQVFGEDGCLMIVRTWTVTDWCVFVPGGTTGVFTDTQVIEVIDNDAPTFTCPSDLTTFIDGVTCSGTVELPQILDAQDCGDVNVAVQSDFGAGFGPFTGVDPGIYSATYFVTDDCGNAAPSCTIQITVEDAKKPTPVCMNGLIIEIMQTGMVTVNATQLDAGSFNNCGGPVKISFSPDEFDTQRTYDCFDIGTQVVQLWVTNENGLQDFCTTFVQIQDNMNVCSPPTPTTGMISGQVFREDNVPVEQVMIDISNSGLASKMVDDAGYYAFDDVPLGGDYSIVPTKSINPVNGVTTLDIVHLNLHVLGHTLLDSPYKIIAADLNNSQSLSALDIIAMQRIILGLDTIFVNSPSWRFVDASYAFNDPTNPLGENYPQVRNINNFDGDQMNVNFVAVKMGDLNMSAAPDNLHEGPSTDDRSGEAITLHAQDRAVRAGETITVTLSAPESLLGLQGTLHLDGLAFADQTSNSIRPLENALVFSIPDAAQRASDVLQLTFIAERDGRLAEMLRLSDDHLRSEGYAADLTPRPLRVEFQETLPEAWIFHAPAPNPFAAQTTLRFDLPTEGEVHLEIYGAQGRRFVAASRDFAAGTQRWTVQRAELGAAGTYFYRVRFGEEVTAGRLVMR